MDRIINALMVDDEQAYGKLIKRRLEREGFHLLQVNNGVEAQEILKSYTPDVLIVDLMMPLMDGRQFLKWFRNEWKGQQPALLMTAVRGSDLPEELKDLATQIAQKPLNVTQLLAKLREMMGQSND